MGASAPRTGSLASVRLTDQALVAVALARRIADGRRATAADLIAGLAVEPEGGAGLVLRSSLGVVDLERRASVAPPGVPPLDAVVRAAADAGGRPSWTVELLDAAVVHGGQDVQDMLEATGLDVWDLRAGPRSTWLAWRDEVEPFTDFEAAYEATRLSDLCETFGLGNDVGALTAAADRTVARARALGGRVRDLLLALRLPGSGAEALLADSAALAEAATRATGPLDPVLAAAQTAPPPVDPGTLALAALAAAA